MTTASQNSLAKSFSSLSLSRETPFSKESQAQASQTPQYPYPFNTFLESNQGLKQIVKYERHPHLDPLLIQRMLKPKVGYEFRSTKNDPEEKLYDRSLRDPASTLKTSGSMSMLPMDYFQRHISNRQTATNVLVNDKDPYLFNPNFYSPQQRRKQAERFDGVRQSEQPLALKILDQAAIKPTEQYFQGPYANHHQVGARIYWDQTYDPKDHRYNKNHDEFNYGIKVWKLSEDLQVRKMLELDEPGKDKSIFKGAIDYSKGTLIAPLRNFNGNDNLNAVLQLLFETYPLTHHFLNDHYKQDLNEERSRYKGRMLLPYVKLLIMHKNHMTVVTPFDLLAAIYKHAPQFQYGDLFGRIREDVGIPQSDPSDILRFLIECLHEELNRVRVRVPDQNFLEIPRTMLTNLEYIANEYWAFFRKKEDSIITELFTGQIHDRTKCLSCSLERDVFHCFNDISLDLPNDTQDPIIPNKAGTYQQNPLQGGPKSSRTINTGAKMAAPGEEEYLYDLIQQMYQKKLENRKCPNMGCGNYVYEGPHEVSSQIWRFPIILLIHFQRFKPHLNKSTIPISFPLDRFDLTINCKASTHPSKQFASTYKLYAILHHSGDQATGHYWTDVLNQSEQQWYKCEDAQVQARSDFPQTDSSRTAYILAYYRKNGRS